MSTPAKRPTIDRTFKPPVAREPKIAAGWERAVFIHIVVFVVGLSWWFGGQSPGARQALLVWGTIGIGLFIFVWGAAREHGGNPMRPVRYLWPLLLFDVLVIISLFNPTTRLELRAGEQLLVHVDPRWSWLPSTARPELTLRELWQFNGIVLSCFNVFLVLRRRSLLRQLLAVIAANALALAVFGTFQKLSGADGIWFGKIPVPQPYFFGTFVYHNHWGAFTLLNLAACLGFLFHALRRSTATTLRESPALLGTVAIIFIAATIPLSGSRSSTVLGTLFLLGALGHFILRLIRQRRMHHESVAPHVAAILCAAVVAFAGIGYLARDVIRARAHLTTQQIYSARQEDGLNSRLQLYSDTWRMASVKPVFGWGLETYGTVFQIYNSQLPQEGWFQKRVYQEAHSDWLQALAEVGFAGTALLVALGVATLIAVRWRRVRSQIPFYLLAGAGIVLVYAWLEFPFANPSVMLAFWLSVFVAARYARLDLEEQIEEYAPNDPRD
jgi:O-antigen ligase